jgi:hypothetical protein
MCSRIWLDMRQNEVELSAVNGYTRVVQGFKGIICRRPHTYMIRPEHQFDIRPDLRKAASTKAESTTAESVIRPKQLVRIKNQCTNI